MFLTIELIERSRAHPVRERLPGIVVIGESEWLSFH
jgi:hypothetical protein